MNTPLTPCDDDSFQFGDESSTVSATLETMTPPDDAAAEWTGPRCEKCERADEVGRRHDLPPLRLVRRA